jgi:hypothetical protein
MMALEITYRLLSTRGRGYKGEEPSHPHHKELGGEEGKEQEDFESLRGRSSFSITLEISQSSLQPLVWIEMS